MEVGIRLLHCRGVPYWKQHSCKIRVGLGLRAVFVRLPVPDLCNKIESECEEQLGSVE